MEALYPLKRGIRFGEHVFKTSAQVRHSKEEWHHGRSQKAGVSDWLCCLLPDTLEDVVYPPHTPVSSSKIGVMKLRAAL